MQLIIKSDTLLHSQYLQERTHGAWSAYTKPAHGRAPTLLLPSGEERLLPAKPEDVVLGVLDAYLRPQARLH